MHRIFVTALLSLTPALTQAADDVVDAATSPAAAGSPFASLLPLILIFFVFYFVLIRPQQDRMKKHKAELATLKKGDKIVTGGGIIGKITKVSADVDTMLVEIAAGIEVHVLKATVTGLVGGTPVTTAEKKKSGSNKNDNAVPSRDSIANDN